MNPTCIILALTLLVLPLTGLTADQMQVPITSRSAPVLEVDGLKFKDLNRNGKLDAYEDWRLSPKARAANLLKQLTLEEKAGLLVHGTAPAVGNPIGAGQRYDIPAVRTLIAKGVSTFVTRLTTSPADFAEQNNRLQEMAESGRLGIPLVISSDPRNGFDNFMGASNVAHGFTVWPDATGLAAVADPLLVRQFADSVRQEYRAVGIEEALSPQADLATEPRWTRIWGTFGEDAALATRLVKAYVQGIQGGDDKLAADGVAAVVKHWTGYGAARDGWDSHNVYGRFATFPTNNFAYHIQPFRGAFAAGVSAVMPTYSILDGAFPGNDGHVGGGFNRPLLQLLRGKEGFKGVIISDWAITEDCSKTCLGGWAPGQPPSIGMPWGVETMSREDRFAKTINAGVDQIGGSDESELILKQVRAGKIEMARVNEAAERVLIQKFQLGLFENPYADPAAADHVVGNAAFQKEALAAQQRSLVLLKNKNDLLPLKPKTRVYLRGINAAVATEHGLVVVDQLKDAEVALIRTSTPFQSVHSTFFFGSIQHEGDLDFKPADADFQAIIQASRTIPTVVSIYLDRPAILTNLNDSVAALMANFGISDTALLDVLTGRAAPEGRLPFELPSSMDEVRTQASDAPHDTAHPLYGIFSGLRYEGASAATQEHGDTPRGVQQK